MLESVVDERAIGAQKRDVFALVIKEGLKVTLIGLAIGIAISLGLSRLISSQLHEVSPADPLTYALAALLLIGVAMAACYFPARWAQLSTATFCTSAFELPSLDKSSIYGRSRRSGDLKFAEESS